MPARTYAARQSDYSRNPALIIFIKNPLPGKVKTRLAATMGNDRALRVYLALLDRVRQLTLTLPYEKYLYYSDFIEEHDEWPAAHYAKRVQYAGDLGERMSRAFAAVLQTCDKAVIIGSDVPGITGSIIGEAFEKLAGCDFTIGGTEDGGYYLLGMSAYEPAVFQGVEWSTPEVFRQTMGIIEGLGKTCHQLPILPDIDYEEDWLKHGWAT